MTYFGGLFVVLMFVLCLIAFVVYFAWCFAYLFWDLCLLIVWLNCCLWFLLASDVGLLTFTLFMFKVFYMLLFCLWRFGWHTVWFMFGLR